MNYHDSNEVEQNALLGAASMLAGYCRMTYSLTVLMLETTQSINLFIPMIITMLFSYGTGLLFNQSLYLRALRTKQVPFLKNEAPSENCQIRAKIIMTESPYTLMTVPTAGEIGDALATGYSVFPILNMSY